MAADEPAGAGPGDLLLAALALAPFAVDYSHNLFDFAALPQAVFCGAAAAGVGAWYALGATRAEKRLALKLTPWHALLGSFLLWCGLSGLWARAGWEWWQAWRHWLAAGAAGALAAAAGRPPARWALAAIFASSCAQALLCAGQYFGFAAGVVPQLVAPGGTFGHRSFAMEWLLLGAPFGAVLWQREGRPAVQLALGLGTGLIVGVVVLSNARAAWLGLAAEALLLAAVLTWSWRRGGSLVGLSPSRWASAAAGLLLAAILIAGQRPRYTRQYGDYSARLSGMLEGLSGDPASSGRMRQSAVSVNNVRMRIAIWRNSLTILRRHWWGGVGLGNFSVEYPRFCRAITDDGITGNGYLVDHAHNDVLEVLVETGAVGLLLLVSLTAATFRGIGRQIASDGGWGRAWATGSAAAIAGIAVDGQFVFPAHLALPPMAVAVMAGLSAGSGAGKEVRPPRWATASAGSALAVLAIFSLFDGARRMAADRHYATVQAGLLAQERTPNLQPAARPRDIEAELATATRLSPEPRYERSLGATLGQEGRWDEALALLLPYLESHPNDPGALADASLVLSFKGRRAEALQTATRAVEIRANANTLDALGLAQRANGLHAEAARSFARASDFDPQDPSLPLREWAAFLAVGDGTEAESAFRRARALDPVLAAQALAQVRKASQGRPRGD